MSEKAKNDADQTNTEASEYWTIFEHHLKITDTLLALFTFILIVVGAWQGVQLKSTVDLAREEFISTHRPKIIIHAIDAKRIPNHAKPETSGSGMERLGAVLLCVNKGRNTAINVEIRGAALANQGIPDAKIQRPIIKTVNSLESGIKIWTEIDTERSFQEIVAFKQPIFFIGTIAYFDKNENRRETGFCYMFDLNSGSWRRTESEAHNYAY